MSLKKIIPVLSLALIAVALLFLLNRSGDQIDRSVYQWQGLKYHSVDDYLTTYKIEPNIVDRESFQVVSDGLAYDAQHIYYLYEIIDNTDNDTIEEYRTKQFNTLKKQFLGPDLQEWDLATFQALSLEAGVFRDQNNVYYAGIKKDIPRDKIQVIDELIYTDGQKAYVGIDTVLDLNLKKIQFINGYVTDGRKTYQQNLFNYDEVFDVDPYAMVWVSEYFSKDNNNYYFYGEKLEDIDYDSFKPFTHYAIDKNRAYWILNQYNQTIIENADYDSFEELSIYSAKDKNHFYYEGEIVPEIDANSVTINKYGVLRTEKYAIIAGQINTEVDPNSFKYVENSDYSLDDNAIYYRGEKIPNSNGSAFKFIHNDGNFNEYAQDDQHVYVNNTIIEGALPNQFVPIHGMFFKANNAIFFQIYPINDIDINTFEIIDDQLARDKNTLFYIRAGSLYRSKTVSDPATFRSLGEKKFYQDKNYVYLLNLRDQDFTLLNGVDSASFKLLKGQYFKDAQNIYYAPFDNSKWFKVEADYNSFKVTQDNTIFTPLENTFNINDSTADAKDKTGCFIKGRRIDQCS